MTIHILIPAYEPDEKLVQLTKELIPAFPVTIVDDGSGEAYSDVFRHAEELGATILRHGINRGKGAALKTGIAAIMQREADGIITADSDGQHTASDIIKLAVALSENPDTFILGGRDFSKMPTRSRFGNSISRAAFRLMTGLNISDTQTGLRAMPKCLFEKLLTVQGDRYEYEMNVLLELKRWNAKHMEIPISTVYIDNNRSSHFRSVADGMRVFFQIIKYAASSLCCAAVDYLIYIAFLMFLPAGQSYAAARFFSAVLNYYLNCRLVFGGKPTVSNFVGYTLLALISLTIGSFAVGLFASMGMNKVLAKLLIDSALFLFNYAMQKNVIFRAEKRER